MGDSSSNGYSDAGNSSHHHHSGPSLRGGHNSGDSAAASCKPTKISGTAKVLRVNPTYAYILSEKHGSIFVLPPSVLHNFPESERKTVKIDLSTFLHVDEIVHFTAVSQKNNPNGCRYIAQKVNKSSSANSNAAVHGADRNGPNPTSPKKKAFKPTGKSNAAFSSKPAAEVVTHHQTSRNRDEPETIENVKGIVLDVYEKYGFIQSELYGRIYLPLSACFLRSADQSGVFTATSGDNLDSDDVDEDYANAAAAAAVTNCSEFQKLNYSFFRNDLVVFSAKRQPEKNGCRYVVTNVKEIVGESELREATLSNRHWSSNLPLLDLKPDEAGGYGPVVPVAQTGLTSLPAYDDALSRSTSNQSPRLSNRSTSPAPTLPHPISLPTETGEISKLFPHFGFIKSASLGAVYFTLSNYAGENGGTGITGSADISALTAPVAEPISDLNDVLTVGDRVQFLYSGQPEKNGCCWRAARIRKLAGFNAADFEDFARFLQLQESPGDSADSSPVPHTGLVSHSADYTRSISKVKIMMEVASQTDQKMWHKFVANQPMTPLQKTASCRQNPVKNRDASCQTLVPPEILLLRALKRDRDVWAELYKRYPDLMKYVERLS